MYTMFSVKEETINQQSKWKSKKESKWRLESKTKIKLDLVSRYGLCSTSSMHFDLFIHGRPYNSPYIGDLGALGEIQKGVFSVLVQWKFGDVLLNL